MKFKKSMAVISIVLATLCVFPIFASAASNKNKENNAPSSLQKKSDNLTFKEENATKRATIKILNKELVQQKKQIGALTETIKKDLEGTGGNAAITGSTDYLSVFAALTQVKTLLQQANGNNDYKALLTGIKGKSGTDEKTGLDKVIIMLQNKKVIFARAIDVLNGAIPAADRIKVQKASLIAALQNFQSSAEAKKKTIDTTHTQISTISESNKTLINQIIATFSANFDVLATNPTAAKGILDSLNSVQAKLSEEYNGKMVQANKAYDDFRKAEDYTNALAQLDLIIKIQTDRIVIVNDVKAQLTTIVGQLNTLVSSGSSSNSTSNTSSKAA
jgi:hypothetical protein